MIRVRRLTLILNQTVGEVVSQRDLSAGHNHADQNERSQIKKMSCFKSQKLARANSLLLTLLSINGQHKPSALAPSPTLLLRSAFFFYITFSLFICLLHPRIHIETIRFRSNSLLEKTSGWYRAVRRAANQNYQRFSERRLRAQNQTFSPHPGVCLRIHGGRADGSGQSTAVNYRHCCCRLVTYKSKQSVARDYSVRTCTCCHIEPTEARNKRSSFDAESIRVPLLL